MGKFTPLEAELLEALERLVHGTRAILERGHERITELGGECDPVAKMFASDPAIQAAVAAISRATQTEGK